MGTCQRPYGQTKAQVLSTGLIFGEDNDDGDDFVNRLKNGRKENRKKGISAIGGYPGLLRKQGQNDLPAEWTTLFEPQEAIIRKLQFWWALILVELHPKRPFFYGWCALLPK